MAEPIFLWLLVLLGTWLVLLLFGGCRSAVHASSRRSSAAVAPGSERSARSPGAAAEALRACRQMAMEDTGGAGEGLQVTCPSHLRYRVGPFCETFRQGDRWWAGEVGGLAKYIVC